MIKLITGGDFRANNNEFALYCTFPEISNSKTKTLKGKEHKCTKILFNSGFLFTRNKNYVNILIRIFGFGLGIEIKTLELK